MDLDLKDSVPEFVEFHRSFMVSTVEIDPKLTGKCLLPKDFVKHYCEKTIQLSNVHVVKVWKIFLKHVDHFNSARMELFALFLSHIRISDPKPSEKKKLNHLIHLSAEKLMSLRYSDCHLNNARYSLASVKLLLNGYASMKKPVIDFESIDLCDLSNVFPEIDADTCRNYYSFQEWETTGILMKFMIFNYKLLKLNYADDEIPWKELLNHLMDKLLNNLKNNAKKHGSIVKEMVEFFVSEQRGSRLRFAAILEFLLDDFVKERNTMYGSDDVLVDIFKCTNNWESQTFQNAFVNSFLKQAVNSISNSPECHKFFNNFVTLFHKEKTWLKHGCDTPNLEDKKHVKMIDLIKQTGNVFQSDMSTGEIIAKSDTEIILRLVSLFSEAVPIEYLSPFNQIRAIIIMSGFLMRIAHVNTKTSKKIFDHLLDIHLRLWSCVRGTWFFNFVPANHYICILQYYLQPCTDIRCRALIEKLVANLFKPKNDLDYVHRLVQDIQFSRLQIEHTIMIQAIILRHAGVNRKRFGKKSNQYEEVQEKQYSLLEKNILLYLNNGGRFNTPVSGLVTEGIIELFEYEFGQNRFQGKLLPQVIELFMKDFYADQCNQNDFNHLFKFLLKYRSKIHQIEPEHVFLKLWTEIIRDRYYRYNGVENLNNERLYELIHWKKMFRKKAKLVQYETMSEEFLGIETLAERYDSITKFIKSAHSDLLVQFIESATAEELIAMIDLCQECCLETELIRSMWFVYVLSLVAKSKVADNKAKVFEGKHGSIMQTLLLLLFLANKETCRQRSEVVRLKVMVLEFCKHSIDRFIALDRFSCHHQFLIYNAWSEVNIFNHSSNITLYSEMFVAMVEPFTEMISKRSYLVAESMCTGNTVLTTLMASLITVCDEKNLTNATDHEKIRLENCAQQLQHLVIRLANVDDFRPYGWHLIGRYLELSSQTAIPESIKQSLNVAIFHVIDAMVVVGNNADTGRCQTFYSQLSQPCRELWNRLFEHYDQYHRFKGYV